nr:SDR family oxidoreductase [Coxiella burnetii]
MTTGTINFVVTGIASYAMTKAALNTFTKYLSVELRSRNILVTATHPGVVKTGLVDSVFKQNAPELGISQAHEKFQKENKYLDVDLSAKFLSWLLLDADDSLYTGDVIGVYNKQYQSLWSDKLIPSPYPADVEAP